MDGKYGTQLREEKCILGLVVNPEGTRLRGTPKHSQEDNIKRILKKLDVSV
jgi:hypothetical protein